jgi:polysaccharide export outer membrane protein
MTAFQAFEGARDQEYTLGSGDQISVSVMTRPDLSGKHTIGPDGRITLPYAGSILVADLTREAAAAAIRAALMKYFVDPIVVVGVDVYTSNHVLVLGAVEHPGLMTFDEPPTLVSVVSRAGMAGSVVQSTSAIQGKPTGVPERVAIYRGNKTILWADFKKLLEDGNPMVQMRLQRNDVIYVPSANERYVSVFGAVLHPGLLQLQDGATLAQMLAEVGGIVTDKSGRLPKIQIVHDYPGSTETVAYEDILTAKPIGLKLQAGDIIYVPESKFERLAVTFEKISPLISIATIGTLIER